MSLAFIYIGLLIVCVFRCKQGIEAILLKEHRYRIRVSEFRLQGITRKGTSAVIAGWVELVSGIILVLSTLLEVVGIFQAGLIFVIMLALAVLEFVVLALVPGEPDEKLERG